jgi:hypothetical protein
MWFEARLYLVAIHNLEPSSMLPQRPCHLKSTGNRGKQAAATEGMCLVDIVDIWKSDRMGVKEYG